MIGDLRQNVRDKACAITGTTPRIRITGILHVKPAYVALVRDLALQFERINLFRILNPKQ